MKTLITIATIAFVSSCAPAMAQNHCADRDTVLSRLAEKYGETIQSYGLAPNGHLAETYASEKTGTWTITLTSPQGQTCLIATGTAFTAQPAAPRPEPNI